MGVIENYACDNCGFKISIDLRAFFYDSELKETIDYTIGPLTRNLGKNAQIKGFVHETYCWNCEKFIKIYVIREKDNLENISEIVEQGIHNFIDNKIIKVDKLKEIEKREEYIVETRKYNPSPEIFESFYVVTFPELNGGYEFKGYVDENKKEVINRALASFHKKIKHEIDYCQRTYKKGIETNYMVLDDSNDSCSEFYSLEKISCPVCHAKVNRKISEENPCPKCNGKISLKGTLFT